MFRGIQARSTDEEPKAKVTGLGREVGVSCYAAPEWKGQRDSRGACLFKETQRHHGNEDKKCFSGQTFVIVGKNKMI